MPKTNTRETKPSEQVNGKSRGTYSKTDTESKAFYRNRLLRPEVDESSAEVWFIRERNLNDEQSS